MKKYDNFLTGWVAGVFYAVTVMAITLVLAK